MNTECNRIADQLVATLNGEAWYGDSLQKILQGVTAAQASSRPIPCAHSIWELVAHVEVWCGLAEGAARGVPMPAWSTMSKDQDWPPVTGSGGQQAWEQVVTSFFSSHLKLTEAIRVFGDERLGSTVPGRKYDFYKLFQGMTQHAVYHGGQIALLKKALG